MSTPDPLSQDRAALLKERATITGPSEEEVIRQKNAAMAPDEARLSNAYGDAAAVKPPGTAQLPATPNKPLVDPNDYSKFSASLLAIALIAGGASRGNWYGVQSSLNGALKGYLEGNHQRADEEWKRYQADFDKAVERHHEQQQDYLATLENKKLTINQIFTEIQTKAAKWDDQALLARARQKRFDEMTKQIYTMDHQMEDLKLKRKQVDSQVAARIGGFGGPIGDLMAALAERGVSLPAGLRSKQQQQAVFQGLLDRNPGKSADEIADMVEKGQISFGAEKKETQTAAGVAGRVAVAQNEIKTFAPLVRESSKQVPRGQFVPINQLLQAGEASISDPHLKDLRIKINSLLNAYDMLAARGGTDKHKREEAHAMLTSADSHEALEAGLNAFLQEADAAERAAQAAEAPHGAKTIHWDDLP